MSPFRIYLVRVTIHVESSDGSCQRSLVFDWRESGPWSGLSSDIALALFYLKLCVVVIGSYFLMSASS